MYYAFIQDNKLNGCGECRQLTEDVLNVEITNTIYNNIEKYIWDGSDVVLNPDWEKEKEEQEKQRRNQEIDSKIKELREMSLIDIMNNNKENIKIYNDVISGLELSRP